MYVTDIFLFFQKPWNLWDHMTLKKNLPPAPQQSKFALPWADDFSCVFCIGSVMSIHLACFAASAGAGVGFGVTRWCRFFNPFSKLSHFLKNLHRLIYEGIWLLQRGKTEGSKGGRDLDPCPRQLWMWENQCNSSLWIASIAVLHTHCHLQACAVLHKPLSTGLTCPAQRAEESVAGPALFHRCLTSMVPCLYPGVQQGAGMWAPLLFDSGRDEQSHFCGGKSHEVEWQRVESLLWTWCAAHTAEAPWVFNCSQFLLSRRTQDFLC